MAANKVLDFQDIIDAVLEELKYQSSDTVSIARIKRDINMGYVHEVIPYKRWWWLQASTKIVHNNFWPQGAITVSVTPDSTAITFSTAPDSGLGSFKGYRFSVDGFDEIYEISAHTAGATAATLTSTYQGSLNATASFKVWRDRIDLPTDCRETIEVGHNRYSGQMKPIGYQDMRRIRSQGEKVQGFPVNYTTTTYYDPSTGDAELETDRYRQMIIHPAISQQNVTINVDYIKEVAELDDGADEPLIPREDRIVLVYYALFKAWTRERNPEAAAQAFSLFQKKLDRMAGDTEDSMDTPSVSPKSRYLRAMRTSRHSVGQQGIYLDSASGGSGGSSSVDYLKGVTIEGASITDNVTVSTGVTIDGRDIGVDGAALDAHIAASDGVHGVTGDVVGTTDTQTLTNKSIDADSNVISNIDNGDIKTDADIARSKLASGTANHVLINDGSGVMSSEARLDLSRTADGTANQVLIAAGVGSDPAYGLVANANVDASAAIELSKLEALTANRILESDGSGEISASDRTSDELDYLQGSAGWSSASLTDNTTNGTVASWADTNDSVWLEFAITRGSTTETGILFIASDGSNASVATFSVDQGGSNGITFDAIVSGGNLTLRYTTTSTGSAATMNYRETTRTVA